MEIIVEDTKVDIDLPDREVTLKDVVDEVEEFLLSVGRIPNALNINGKELSQEEMDERMGELMQGSEVITFGCVRVFDFLLENLEGAKLANQQLVGKVKTFAEEIHEAEKTVEGEHLVLEFNNFFDFWVKFERLLPDDVNTLKFDDKPFSDFFEGVKSLLEEVVSALEASDLVLAADLLQYEIVPSVEKIDQVIPDLQEKIKIRHEKDLKEEATT